MVAVSLWGSPQPSAPLGGVTLRQAGLRQHWFGLGFLQLMGKSELGMRN